MAGWHEGPNGTSITATRSLRERLAALWQRIRRA